MLRHLLQDLSLPYEILARCYPQLLYSQRMIFLEYLRVALLCVFWLFFYHHVLLLVLLFLEHFLSGVILLLSYSTRVFLDHFVNCAVFATAHLDFNVVLLLKCSRLADVSERC